MLVGDIPRLNARRFPNYEALVDVKRDIRVTHRQLNERVNRLADSLLSLGLSKWDRVAILSLPTFRYAESYLANAKLGLISVPLNTWFTSNELAFILSDCEASAVFVAPEFIDRVSSIQDQLPILKYVISLEGDKLPLKYEDMIDQGSPAEPQATVLEGDIYILPYTSGTTTFPKGVLITHKNVITASLVHQGLYGLKPGDRFLVGFPLFFAVSLPSVITPLFSGGCAVLQPFDPGDFLRTVEKERITDSSGVATHLSRILRHPDLPKYDHSSLRRFMVAGGPVPVPLLREGIKIFGRIFYQNYGLTEAAVLSCSMRSEWMDPEDPDKIRRLSSCGKPVNTVDIEIVNNERQPIPWGSDEIGEVLIKGDTVAKSYWKRPDLDKEAFWNGWLCTGDMARRDEEGFIYVVERKSDMIISGGINIYPKEIENIIAEHPNVEMVAVIGIPHEDLGESVKAVVQLKPGTTATEEEIIDLCRKNLASYKKPKSVDFVPELPLSSTGKILKRELKEKYSGTP